MFYIFAIHKNNFLSKTKQNRLVIITLVITFVMYNYFVYTQTSIEPTQKLSELAIKGQQLYQENNCTACHQIYGLGGYLGPDLTNIISNPNKGPEYVKAFLNSGIKSMPKFNFSEDEKEAFVQFLSEVDKTGYYPNYKAEMQLDGWVKLMYKTNE